MLNARAYWQPLLVWQTRAELETKQNSVLNLITGQSSHEPRQANVQSVQSSAGSGKTSGERDFAVRQIVYRPVASAVKCSADPSPRVDTR